MPLPRTAVLRDRHGILAQPGDRPRAATTGPYRHADSHRSRTGGAGSAAYSVAAAESRRDKLTATSRDLETNSEIYDAIISRIADLVGQPWPRPQTGNDELDAWLAERFRRQATIRDGFDVRRLLTWDSLTLLWWRSLFRDGDLCAIKLDNGLLCTVEADQICGGRDNQYTRTVGGVTLGVDGEPTKVWIAGRDPRGTILVRKAEPYPWSTVLWFGLPNRYCATRSLPLLASGTDNIERADSLVESEVISSEQASLIHGAIERDQITGVGAAPLEDADEDVPGNDDGGADAPEPRQFDAGSAFDFRSQPGTRWKPTPMVRPNLDVPDFVISLLRTLCARAGLAYEVVFCDWRGLSWSTSRTLVSEANKSLKSLRESWLEPSLDEFWRWRVADWLAEPDAPQVAVPDPFRVAWDWPRIPWPDPTKEAQANEKNFQLRTASRVRVIGPEWKDIEAELHLEEKTADQNYVARFVAAAQAIEDARRANPAIAAQIDLTAREVLARSQGQTGPSMVQQAPIMAADDQADSADAQQEADEPAPDDEDQADQQDDAAPAKKQAARPRR